MENHSRPVDALRLEAMCEAYWNAGSVPEKWASETEEQRAVVRQRMAVALSASLPRPVDALREAATRLLAIFDKQKQITTAERIITGKSDKELRNAGNAAIDELRAALEAAALAPLAGREGAGSVDALAAMRETLKHSEPGGNCDHVPSLSHEHLLKMLATMEAGGFSYGKLCRWLGWAQAAVVANGDADLDTMKQINRRWQAPSPVRTACDHNHYDFSKHGRRCTCGAVMSDAGD